MNDDQPEPDTPAPEIFLCHNNLDADIVRHIADALELEAGTPFFLDAFAIPDGVEFMPEIEAAMETAKGCAIFLGENGWGPTHLWEAGLALTRYRQDRDFRLIPVVLPGASDADMDRLGNGSVFKDINRSELTGQPPSQDQIQQLAAALSGTAAPQYRAPAKLTPYQLRRDAERWGIAKKTSKKAAAAILYRGADLKEAQDIMLANPDFVVIAEVQPFIAAALAEERNTLRRITAIALAASFTFITIAAVAYYNAKVAESRRLESLSRALAIQASQDETPGRQLLIALEATKRSNTAEAQGAVLSMLEKWRWLLTEHHIFNGVTASATGPGGTSTIFGSADGTVHRLAGTDGPQYIGSADSSITALAENQDTILVGTLDGTVESMDAQGNVLRLLEGFGRQAYVTAIATSPDGSIMVIGDHEGRVHILRPDHPTITHDAGDMLQINALAVSPDMTRIVALTDRHRLVVYEGSDWQETRRWPLTASALDAAFLEDGRLVWITSNGLMRQVAFSNDDITINDSYQFNGFFSHAVIDANTELVALGEVGGFVQLTNFFGHEIGFKRIRAHSDTISGLSIQEEMGQLVTAAQNGSVSRWVLDKPADFGRSLPSLVSEPLALLVSADGAVLGATRSEDEAAIWRLEQNAWVLVSDLVSAIVEVLGAEAGRLPTPGPDSDGFEDISTTLIDQIVLTETGVAWSTWNGAVLWLAFTEHTGPRLIREANGYGQVLLAAAPSGRSVAVTEEGSSEIQIIDSVSTNELQLLHAPEPVETMDFAPSGTELAIGTSRGSVLIASLPDRQTTALPDQHAAPISGTIWLGDGDLVSYASGGSNDRGLLFHRPGDVDATLRVASLRPGGAATASDYNSDLDLIAITDHDGMVHLWRASERRFVHSLFFGGSYLPAVALDPTARRVIAADGSGNLWSWPLNPSRWEAIVCAKVGRSLTTVEWNEVMAGEEFAPVCAADQSNSGTD
ncbi:toll/interleukin-1 receptor domain-containing protein [Leisingera caerulea]|uniref:Toll/interleukin-1 receptor domain-containing protein n=1 Tax=Leisingera caerulea TaxID=506591 RepID=A0ABY5WYU9_LEICA|nr:toll/interleukin-1 receptor domain-containing protein [Leisingera caerulea]UWQ59343.1 toll/interleukin-1 receptor domain-containing protein [Leisingera caerulea]